MNESNSAQIVHAGVVHMLFQNFLPVELHEYWSVPNKLGTTPLHVYVTLMIH